MRRLISNYWPLLALLSYYLLLGWLIYRPPGASLYLTGADKEPGPIYGFWSGFGGSLLFSAAVLFPPWYYQHSCHDHFSCLRWGKYQAAGGIFKTCWRHHPESDGENRPDGEIIKKLHGMWSARSRA